MGPGGASGPPGQGERSPAVPPRPPGAPGLSSAREVGRSPDGEGRPGLLTPGDQVAARLRRTTPPEAPPAPCAPGGNKWASDEPPRGPRAHGRREPDLRSP